MFRRRTKSKSNTKNRSSKQIQQGYAILNECFDLIPDEDHEKTLKPLYNSMEYKDQILEIETENEILKWVIK